MALKVGIYIFDNVEVLDADDIVIANVAETRTSSLAEDMEEETAAENIESTEEEAE
jgi:hypothetical protein